MKTLQSFFLSLLCATSAVYAASVPPTFNFQNQRGSVLNIMMLDNHSITGTFTTAVASKTCPQAVNQTRPIKGYWIGNAVSFSVFYPDCGSVLSIIGNLSQDQTSLDTMSILNKQAEDVTTEGPGARFIGHDFYRVLP